MDESMLAKGNAQVKRKTWSRHQQRRRARAARRRVLEILQASTWFDAYRHLVDSNVLTFTADGKCEWFRDGSFPQFGWTQHGQWSVIHARQFDFDFNANGNAAREAFALILHFTWSCSVNHATDERKDVDADRSQAFAFAVLEAVDLAGDEFRVYDFQLSMHDDAVFLRCRNSCETGKKRAKALHDGAWRGWPEGSLDQDGWGERVQHYFRDSGRMRTPQHPLRIFVNDKPIDLKPGWQAEFVQAACSTSV